MIPEFDQKGYMLNFSFFSTQLTYTYVMKGASIICKVKNRYYQKILIMLITLPARWKFQKRNIQPNFLKMNLFLIIYCTKQANKH